jgi:hypothetical protein
MKIGRGSEEQVGVGLGERESRMSGVLLRPWQ